jgi:hypothetical protein
MRSVAEAILHLAPNPDGFTVQELADEVRPSLPVARDAYPGRQAACDLMKLRGKRLIERIAKKRRYRPPPMRISILAGWLILREKVIKPLRTPTHYTSTWIDVSKEPWILSLPDMKERHFLFLMLDGWTNVFQVPGKRNTGTKAQTYAITGPGWTGKLPASVTEYKSPTGLVWILGRIYSSGPPADYKEVHALQDKVSVVPLSAYEKPYSPAPGTVDPAIDMAGAPKPAQELIMGGLKGGTVAGDSKLEYGWLFSTKVGQYGTSYVQRALVTAIGLGANRSEVAVYPTSKGPDIAARYSGEKKYVMHFEKGQQPPVNGFWSLTRYDSDYFFFDNPLNRYNLSQRNKFKVNPDGSVDPYIQNESPGKDMESNWCRRPRVSSS